MAIHGNKLITLSLPNIVVRLSDNKRGYNTENSNNGYYSDSNNNNLIADNDITDDLTLSNSVNVSFIDNNDLLRLLSFQYTYDLSDSKI